MTRYKVLTVAIAALGLTYSSCTKLDEKLGSTITKSQADSVIKVPALLKTAYDALQLPYQDQSNYWALCEMTSDEAVAPTRGGDWDDNGVWRALKLHAWTPDHTHVNDAFNNILTAEFAATNVLNFNPSAQQSAEARFLRAWTMFSVLDGWGQVPYRQPGDTLLNPPKVLVGNDALTFIVSELEAIINDLPAGPPATPAYTANKIAAKTLLMKCYLNKGAFTNRQAPTFDPADMTKVVALADEIIGTGNFSLANNIFDNFAYNNDAISTENIFTQQNGPGLSTARGGNSSFCRWAPTLHYNQRPSGWNGFATTSDFYDKFEAADTRRGVAYTGVTNISGLRVGFLIGQQVDQTGKLLEDRKGNKLIFTRELALETGTDLEVKGIRVVKYPPDFVTLNGTNSNNASNDYVFLRYADVLLMKAEALLRNNGAAAALTIVNNLRVKRGATPLGALTLANMLDERGREFYWEGWRRQDLIRFGKFLEPRQLKPTDDKKYLLFPIPANAKAVNPNLTQNDGY
ncbi:RagB/SusD family nutrient uptake outer membrane protein [Chitinophaga sedimenti]|uniref:RagB/SusD family nutrient uptake outer membrane protein n=1 Tax=Chitinophaga sedimenti TaxID=2033606 RepID=UPI0020069B30|nr:RagB/SusD family nutrient uptake outer membrane protein [Chitinophaga sedimenti]MCK7558462.1 RagB/SusD family nutrient uptake outer membrane protein [Chitinophaga sedimenti]